MAEPSVDATLFRAPLEAVSEFEGATSELVLMGRTLKALKVIVKISNESMRSSEALIASQQTIVNLLRKQVDTALLNGNAGANITGLIPSAGTPVKHSRFVTDGATNTNTTVTSATAAFTAPTSARSSPGPGFLPARRSQRDQRDHRGHQRGGDRDGDRRDHHDHHELRDL